MMNHIEEASHIRSLFRQFGNDDSRTIQLVLELRDVALRYLPAAVIAKVPPPHFSDEIRKAYQAIGKSLEWNLKALGATGAYAFCITARTADLTPSQQCAASLLYACTEALEANTVADRVRQNILDAYVGLDLDAIKKAKKALLQSQNASKNPRRSRRSEMEQRIIKFFKRERKQSNTLKEALASWEGGHIDGGLRLEYDSKKWYIVHDENATVPTSKEFTERQLKTMFSESS